MSKRAFYAFPAFLLAIAFAAPSYGAGAEENYRFYCAQCHGVYGKGDGPNATREMPVSPRDHTNALEMNKLTDEDVINAIAEGGPATSKSSLMPPFGKTLSKKRDRGAQELYKKALQLQGQVRGCR